MKKPILVDLIYSVYFWNSSGWVHQQCPHSSVYDSIWWKIFPNIRVKYYFTNFVTVAT